jgi:hypothetical protein
MTSTDESSSETGDGGGFLDVEAAEAESTTVSVAESEHFFPQFARLPVELRRHIWEHFCPDLLAPGRMLRFSQWLSEDGLSPGPYLEEQTAAARAMMATHRESRAQALSKWPDALNIESSSVLRFNRDKDVIHFLHINVTPLRSAGRQIRNVAFDSEEGRGEGSWDEYAERVIPCVVRDIPDLQSVFVVHSHHWAQSPRSIHWCASSNVKRYSLDHTEYDEVGIPRALPHMWVWPDLERHADYALDTIQPLQEELGYAETSRLNANLVEWRFSDAPASWDGFVWPIVQFLFDEGMAAYDRLVEGDLSGSDGGESDDSRDESDEYESEGIDDTMQGFIESSSEEEDDDLVVQPLSELDSDDGNDGGDQHDARFSSIEPDPAGNHEQSPTPSEDGLRRGGSRKRRIVSSDSDEASDDEPSMQVRPTKRRARIAPSDSEEEDDASSDPESAEDEGGGGGGGPLSLAERLAQHRQRNPVSPSQSGSEGGSGLHRATDEADEDGEDELDGELSDEEAAEDYGGALILDASEHSESPGSSGEEAGW